MPSARERARAELTRDIKAIARAQLSRDGAAGLSLRAVARELGMVSSAVYRYFPSRDDLLTALIVDAYDEVGAAAESAEAQVRRSDVLGRWLAAARAVREWAVGQPQQWALIFGSPVPGYAAPQDTIASAIRIPMLLLSIVADGTGDAGPVPPLPASVRAGLMRAAAATVELPAPLMARAVMAWTHLIGCISFELFGHLVGSVDPADEFFEHEIAAVAGRLGLTED
jgi:AcrR family transcriptional regulator